MSGGESYGCIDDSSGNSPDKPKENGKFENEITLPKKDSAVHKLGQTMEAQSKSDDESGSDIMESQDFLVSDTQIEDNSVMIPPTSVEEPIIVPSTPPHILDQNTSNISSCRSGEMEKKLDFEEDDEWNTPTQVLSKETVHDISFDDNESSHVIDDSVVNVSKHESPNTEHEKIKITHQDENGTADEEWNLSFTDMEPTPPLENLPQDVEKYDDEGHSKNYENGVSSNLYESRAKVDKNVKSNLDKPKSVEEVSLKAAAKELKGDIESDDSLDDENEVAPSQTNTRNANVFSRSSQELRLCSVVTKVTSNLVKNAERNLPSKERALSKNNLNATSNKMQQVSDSQVVIVPDVMKLSVLEKFELPATQKISQDMSIADPSTQKVTLAVTDNDLQPPETQALTILNDNIDDVEKGEVPDTQMVRASDVLKLSMLEKFELPATQKISPDVSIADLSTQKVTLAVTDSGLQPPETKALTILNDDIDDVEMEEVQDIQVVRASDVMKFSVLEKFELPATQKISLDMSMAYTPAQKITPAVTDNDLQPPETQALAILDDDIKMQELPPTQVVMALSNGHVDIHDSENKEIPSVKEILSVKDLPETVPLNELLHPVQAKEVPDIFASNILSEKPAINTPEEVKNVPISELPPSKMEEQVDYVPLKAETLDMQSNGLLEVSKGQITENVPKGQTSEESEPTRQAADDMTKELTSPDLSKIQALEQEENSKIQASEQSEIQALEQEDVNKMQTTEQMLIGQTIKAVSNEKSIDSFNIKETSSDEYISVEVKSMEGTATVAKSFKGAESKLLEVNISSSSFAGSSQAAVESREIASKMLPPLHYKRVNGSSQKKSMAAVENISSPEKKFSLDTPSLDASDFKLERTIGTFNSVDELNALMQSLGFNVDNEKLQAFIRIPSNEERTIFNKHLQCNIILKEHSVIQKWMIVEQGELPWSPSVSSNKTSSFNSLQSGDMADVSSMGLPSSNPSSMDSQPKSTRCFPSQEDALKVTAVTPTQIDFRSPEEKETIIPQMEENSSQDDFQCGSSTSLKHKRSTTKSLIAKRVKKNEATQKSSEFAETVSCDTLKYSTKRKRTRSDKIDKITSSSDSSAHCTGIVRKLRKSSYEPRRKSPRLGDFFSNDSISKPSSSPLADKLSKQTLSTPDAILPNANVMARWADGYYYCGIIQKQEFDGLWSILFDDGELATINENKILKIDVFQPGTEILAKSDTSYYYEVGIVKSVRRRGNSLGYIIEHESGLTKWYPKRAIILSDHQVQKLRDIKPTSPKKDDPEIKSTVRKSKLFQGHAFLISEATKQTDVSSTSDSDTAAEMEKEACDIIPFNKEDLIKHIQSSGGLILETFEDIQKNPRRKVLLIASTHLRTLKYFNCVASNIPCVKHDFIHNSISQRFIQDFRPYLLPTGYSIISNKVIEWHYKTSVFKGLKIVVTADKEKDSNFVENWSSILHSGKADIVQKYTFPTLLNPGMAFPVDLIVTNNTCPANVVATAKRRKIPMVSFEWIIQCVISGKRCPFDAHEKFKYTYTSQNA